MEVYRNIIVQSSSYASIKLYSKCSYCYFEMEIQQSESGYVTKYRIYHNVNVNISESLLI